MLPTFCWPGMKAQSHQGLNQPKIGPTCTVGAHGWWPDAGPCPNMIQPPPPNGTLPSTYPYRFPPNFIMDWQMYFVPDIKDVPPYPDGKPTSPYNVSNGKTYYRTDATSGEVSMIESYESYCIPVFGDPNSSMGSQNHYSCDFINSALTQTAYVVLHEDRPQGSPKCCIIGTPFHPPPPDFTEKMPVKWIANNGNDQVAWNAVYDNEAGIFNYGFSVDTKIPYGFYMMGVPWIANWMWQSFSNFQEVVPDEHLWDLPNECFSAIACPGWSSK